LRFDDTDFEDGGFDDDDLAPLIQMHGFKPVPLRYEAR
jgi:hypothetical protein